MKKLTRNDNLSGKMAYLGELRMFELAYERTSSM